MSLNGLDDGKVKEAHDTAALSLEDGAFLLKYVSRDEVELLGRGNGGIVEIRNAIAGFEEEAPLFGFLRYRRRKVLIKYVPENCSRLVQARVTVHFNAVTERFTPYDTVFSITSSKELRDSSLSKACSLHTAGGSISSSTSSLRRRRLMEIAEDAEEDKRASVVVEERAQTEKSFNISRPQPLDATDVPLLTSPGQESSASFQSIVTDTDTAGPLSLSPPTISDDRPKSPTRSVEERRKSSQLGRPDLYSHNSYTSNGRPKIKLGPRPSLDISAWPQTSASSTFRPVSTLPAGLKLFSRNPKKPKERPQSQHPTLAPSMTLSPPQMLGDDLSNQSLTATLVRPHTSGGQPTSSSGITARAPPSPTVSLMPKPPAMTPEKARLMKALEMRKKKMSEPIKSDPTPEPAIVTPQEEQNMEIGPDPSRDLPIVSINTMGTLNDVAKADSGIVIEVPFIEQTGGSQTTRTSSTPASPMEPSEADSTKASSISESTDETTREFEIPKAAAAMPEFEAASHTSPQTVAGGVDDDLNVIENTKADEISAIGKDELLPAGTDAEKVAQHTDALETPLIAEGESDNNATPTLGEKTTIESKLQSSQEIPQLTVDKSTDSEENIPLVVDEMLPESKFENEPSFSQQAPAVSKGESARQVDSAKDGRQHNTTDKKRMVTMQDLLDAGDSTPVKQWKIPRSKFSMQDLQVSDLASSSVAQKSPVGSTFSIDSKRSLTDEDREEGESEQTRKKRRGLLEPIDTDGAAQGNHSESELDDDFMDELQSAQVQEAKPMMVSKSPITPVFPGNIKKESADGNRFSRAFSNPFAKDGQKPHEASKVDIPSRSVSASAAYLNRINQQQAVPIAKKVNLGSGISQRIKALEKLSNAPPGAIIPPAGPPVSSQTFFSVRKAGGRKSPSIAERAESLTRHTPPPSGSRESSPEAFKARERSESIQSRTSLFNAPPLPQPIKSRPESISVTARIVRDPNQPFELKPEMPHKNPLDYAPLELMQSPLVIDHQKAIFVPQLPKETIQERRLSKTDESPDLSKAGKSYSKESSQDIKKERRSSITIIKDLISDGRNSISERRTSLTGSRKSMTIETPTPVQSPPSKSPSRPPSTHANSPMHHGRPASVSSRRSNSSRELSLTASPGGNGAASISSAPSTPNDEESKKAGRASRMLRRMSSGLSNSRKTLAHAISPTVREESEPPQTGNKSLSSSQLSHSSSGLSITVEIGDVNVQFPDTLLWKRRSMSLDSQGYLLLAQAQGNKGMERAMVNKRYHLSEFRMPFVPEMEVQELPNSVVLDFIEGGGLQIACEDHAGQARILQALQEAHRTWSVYGQ